MQTLVFVSDFFVEHYHGGAELTMQALMDAKPSSDTIVKIQSHTLTPELVNRYKSATWVLVNYSGCSRESLIEIVNEVASYSIIECDYKVCAFRSEHLHEIKTGNKCDCAKRDYPGRFTKGLFRRAHKLFFMSEGQVKAYEQHFPQMSTWKDIVVLGSVWSPKHLDLLEELRVTTPVKNNKWAVLGGASWIKNQRFCEDKLTSWRAPYDVIGGLPYEPFLEKLSQYHGLCFHPLGYDTCPRIVIEAKLMGLDLDLGNLVQHTQDKWWLETKDSTEAMQTYLRTRPSAFWKIILGD